MASLLLVPVLAACSDDHTSEPSARDHGSTLSEDEIATAEAVARRTAADQGATVSSASAIARAGTVGSSNTGHPCTSGRELQIRLIGDFPHTVTSGHPVPPGSPAPDLTVRAMDITADAESGIECLIGVQTRANGDVEPMPGATMLPVASDRTRSHRSAGRRGPEARQPGHR